MTRPALPQLHTRDTTGRSNGAVVEDEYRPWTTTSPQTSNPSSAVSDDRRKQGKPSNLIKKKSSLSAMTSSQGKLNKRSGSTTSVTSPNLDFPTFDPKLPSVSTLPQQYHDFFLPPTLPKPVAKSRVKPLLRRLGSSEKQSGIDLSRTAAENEGLGIYTSVGEREHTSRHYPSPSHHARTTSDLSHHSNSTAPGKYVHPGRKTPRPYTPPTLHSHQNSCDGTDVDDPYRQRSSSYRIEIDAAGSAIRKTPSLPYSRSLASGSQTNLPGTPSALRFANNPMSSSIPYSPTPDPFPSSAVLTARSSIDSMFRKPRSRTNTNATSLDTTASQLAAVQALRAEFNAREAAKDARYRELESRARRKEDRRKEEREDTVRRKSEAQERKMSRQASVEREKVNVRVLVGSTETQGREVFDAADWERARTSKGTKKTPAQGAKAVSNQWTLFWFRFKTMLLKIKRSMGRE
ncbi:hypothetical protein MMC25_003308 [Agyrium rufum]|nr:hypothetical protein [Agyrium rufum]